MTCLRIPLVIFQRAVSNSSIQQRTSCALRPLLSKHTCVSNFWAFCYSSQLENTSKTVAFPNHDSNGEENAQSPEDAITADRSKVQNDYSSAFTKGEDEEVHLTTKEELSTNALEDEFFQESLSNKALSSLIPLSAIERIVPALPVSFSLAAYVNHCETLQQMLKLGVPLHKIEANQEASELLLKLNYEKDVRPYIHFLHDHGVPANELATVIAGNPLIFKQHLEDLQVRVNYLKSKKFSANNIARILTKAPYFITFSTKEIDGRLGFFQKEFKLTGQEVRFLTTRRPKLIIFSIQKIKESTFSIREEMGFSEEETKQLLLTKPKIWTASRRFVMERFDYIHTTMKIQHDLLVMFPGALLMRIHHLRQRHMYLEQLGRNQYDPTKPSYVSLKALVSGSDSDFCDNVSKTSIDDFNEFLRTL